MCAFLPRMGSSSSRSTRRHHHQYPDFIEHVGVVPVGVLHLDLEGRDRRGLLQQCECSAVALGSSLTLSPNSIAVQIGWTREPNTVASIISRVSTWKASAGRPVAVLVDPDGELVEHDLRFADARHHRQRFVDLLVKVEGGTLAWPVAAQILARDP